MFPVGGPVTFNTPLPWVKVSPTSRCSMSKAWVTAPFFINTTELILAASGVCTWNEVPYPMTAGVTDVITGRVAAVPSELKRYGGE